MYCDLIWTSFRRCHYGCSGRWKAGGRLTPILLRGSFFLRLLVSSGPSVSARLVRHTVVLAQRHIAGPVLVDRPRRLWSQGASSHVLGQTAAGIADPGSQGVSLFGGVRLSAGYTRRGGMLWPPPRRAVSVCAEASYHEAVLPAALGRHGSAVSVFPPGRPPLDPPPSPRRNQQRLRRVPSA